MQEVLQEATGHSLKTIFLPTPYLAHYFDRILKRAEIEKTDALCHRLTAHSFRHTFATMMAETVGQNPFILKRILGHRQIATTDRYCHPTTEAAVIDIEEILGEGPAGRGVSRGFGPLAETP